MENIPQVSHLEQEAQLNKMDLLDDPDEGLSEEERARIVCQVPITGRCTLWCEILLIDAGSSTCSKAGHEADPMA